MTQEVEMKTFTGKFKKIKLLTKIQYLLKIILLEWPRRLLRVAVLLIKPSPLSAVLLTPLTLETL